MVDSVMIWNEPNNLAHWDYTLDPEWNIFAKMTIEAIQAIRTENPSLNIILGGISPVDPDFIANMKSKGVIDCVDGVGIHGFPYDWNHWTVNEWPQKITRIGEIAKKPVWVTEVGVSSFGAEDVQVIGMEQSAPLLKENASRTYWYSLLDLPRTWEAVAHQPEAQGNEYIRHFYMGLLREDATPKLAFYTFVNNADDMGICQWFHLNDQRMNLAVELLKKMDIQRVRTGLSWADSIYPGAYKWFDRQMKALENFETCITFCFTPSAHGIAPHHTSPPKTTGRFAEFCASMVKRYMC
ncbi:MAG: beta-xylosidase [Chitinivibrionales bacterium]|nr:beta-xylosidase [Chitinivibrionales bacterium]